MSNPSSHPVFAPGSTALITGAASGIGLAIAKLCKSHGMNVYLIDRNAELLVNAKTELTGGNFGDRSVMVATYDVSKLSDWDSLKRDAAELFGSIELLVLNAGTVAKGGWEDNEYFSKILQTNLFGVINGINTFLPVVKQASAKKPTAIVITGSKQGITNPPGNPAYNASKAAVKSLAEQLGYDLRDSKTSVHLLVPGWTFTGLSGGGPDSTVEKPTGAWRPDQVADYMFKKMAEDKFYILCPDDDVNEETDKKRIAWSAWDIISGRPPLTRWRPEWKKEAEESMAKMDL
ncbi:short chain dehydrogenase/reductase [Eremomyces bilateralis CBS 781.70]|uniref:Short chain dehydrogenase/reductase n=1 Tax=Eremomyces bilateralis CBS 781.70 TaxID=1392243 RepID=A0A6G1G273_9PEZI|nr:short chain dehydrogenase/reductase [Eremomyces bilateralis CBS 781.70]KAF1812118.1 short chain dehydrogenase/reductase [Eremomyces bilateralis CBS 781.70]